MKQTPSLLLACALLFSCAKETEPLVRPEPSVPEERIYTLTVEAEKGERPDTKALDFVETTLKAFWLKGEEVSVYKANALLGTLAAQIAGSTTQLQGQISGEIKKDDVLTLKFLSPDYGSQDGSLAYIASHCDYAVANVTVTDVEGTSVTTTSAQFENQQVIAAFTLRQGENDITADITAMTITSGAEMYAITRPAGPGPIYVAMKAVDNAAIDFSATDGHLYYGKTVSGKTLSRGKYYALTLGMNLDTEMISYVRRSWDEASKSVVSETVVEKASDLNSISEYGNLQGTWYVSGVKNINGITVRKNGTLNLVLCDGATLTTKYIWMDNTSTLRIFGQAAGTGALVAEGQKSDALAIGLYDAEGNGGTMEFHGGVINAVGDFQYPAIGSREYYWERLVIYGGTIVATGGGYGAGIGRGDKSGHQGGIIDIYGGKITATGGTSDYGYPGGSGIGDGAAGSDPEEGGNVEAVNIYGGEINASGTAKKPGISAGVSGKGTVNIYGGKVTTTGGGGRPGIYAKKEINISGGEVFAYAGVNAAAIGGGEDLDNPAVIHISGGTVRAYGDKEGSYGAGIGGGQDSNGGTIEISGGTVYAFGGMDAAGIGCGEETTFSFGKRSGNITITGGWVHAEGKGYGAGIGAGEDASCYAVNIFTSTGLLYVEAIAGNQCVDAGSIGAYDYEYVKWKLNIGPRVRVQTYKNTTVENLVTTEDRAYTVHHRRRAILFTCDHEGYTAQTCPYCTH